MKNKDDIGPIIATILTVILASLIEAVPFTLLWNALFPWLFGSPRLELIQGFFVMMGLSMFVSFFRKSRGDK